MTSEAKKQCQLTQEILIHSATWWMTDEEKIAHLIKTIIAMAISATDCEDRRDIQIEKLKKEVDEAESNVMAYAQGAINE